MIRYSKDHLWIRKEDENTYRIGLTDYAQKELGELAYIELPEVGSLCETDEILCSIDSLKSSSDLYAPFSGTVSDVNENLEGDGAAGKINKDPYGEGWILCMTPDDEEAFDRLLTEDQYHSLTGS